MEVNLLKYLSEESIIINLKGKTKKAIVSTILDSFLQTKKISKDDRKEILKTILQREEMGSTAIGGHVALPHARLGCVKDIILGIGISREGVDFDALDEEPVYVIALLLSNQKEAGLHLKILAALAKFLRDKAFIQQLRNATSKQEVISLITRHQGILI